MNSALVKMKGNPEVEKWKLLIRLVVLTIKSGKLRDSQYNNLSAGK